MKKEDRITILDEVLEALILNRAIKPNDILCALEEICVRHLPRLCDSVAEDLRYDFAGLRKGVKKHCEF